MTMIDDECDFDELGCENTSARARERASGGCGATKDDALRRERGLRREGVGLRGARGHGQGEVRAPGPTGGESVRRLPAQKVNSATERRSDFGVGV